MLVIPRKTMASKKLENPAKLASLFGSFGLSGLFGLSGVFD
jgi:hypothetical protein